MPSRLLLLCACVFILAARPLRADDTNLVLRMFPVPAGFIHTDRPVDFSTNAPFPDGSTSQGLENAQEFYRKCGVSFPTGASITYNPHANLLYHYNTEENQKRFGRIIEQIVGIPFQIQIDATFVDFSRAEIEKLSRAGGGAAPDTGALLTLWKSGQGTLLHTLKLTTRSGVNAQAQAVSEVIYPTEFRTPVVSNAADHLVSPLPVPDVFDTREVGAILNVTPTVGPDKQTIEIVMAPEITAPPEWQTLSVTGTDAQGKEIHLSVPEPVFHSRNITTVIVLRDGETAVLGGMENPRGDGITYLFLSASLIDASGQPLSAYAGDAPR